MKIEKKLLIVILLVFVVLAAAIIIKRPGAGEEESNSHGEETTERYTEDHSSYVEEFVENIGNSEEEALLLSMFPTETFNEEVLYTYLGAATEILEVPLDNGQQLVEVLETILERSSTLSRVFLGIHTEGIKEEETSALTLSYSSDFLSEGFSWEEAILELARKYPEIIFEVVLYYPKISMLTAMEQEEIEGMVDWYKYMADLYCHYDEVPNIHLFMPGCEEWLICNESNYQDAFCLTEVVADEMERLLFCDNEYMVSLQNIEEKCAQLLQLINIYKEDPIVPVQKDDTYVFLGDSVIGNYSGPLSIPGVVSYMSGVEAINCGYGGLSATKESAETGGLEDIVDTLLATGADRDMSGISNENAQLGIQQFWDAEFSKDTDKLVFFLSFGINDYMTGHPVYNTVMDETCYKGALSNAVDKLSTAYPNADIILMTPNVIARGDFGEIANGELGSPYREYIEAVYELGAEKDLQIIDIYQKLGITAENFESYLGDLCHPNYYGRFKIGEIICKHMSGLQS